MPRYPLDKPAGVELTREDRVIIPGWFNVGSRNRTRKITYHEPAHRYVLKYWGVIDWDAEWDDEFSSDDTFQQLLDNMRRYDYRQSSENLFSVTNQPFDVNRDEIREDGTVGRPYRELIPELRCIVEELRDKIDNEPLMVSGKHAVASTHFEQWTGLFQRAALHREDPMYPFKKILLRRVLRTSGERDGLHEIESIDQLQTLVKARLDKHNAVHNARHLVEPELLTLVDAFEAAVKNCRPMTVNNPNVVTTKAAIDAFPAEAKLRAEINEENQTPTPKGLDLIKEHTVQRIHQAAATRLSVLTGERLTWLLLAQATAFDASDLIQRVVEYRRRIYDAPAEDDVTALEQDITAQINKWNFDLTVRAQHTRVRGERAFDLSVTVSGKSYVNVELHQGETPLNAGDYSVSVNPVPFVFNGLQIRRVRVIIQDSVADRAFLRVKLDGRATQSGAVVTTVYHDIGVITRR